MESKLGLKWGHTRLVIALMAIFSFGLATCENPAISVLMFYEDPKVIEGFDLAISYIKNTPSLKVNISSVYKVQANGTDSTALIQSLCKDVDDLFSKPTGERPDIIIDLTTTGIPSGSVKMISREMNIPTISGAYGLRGDTWEWRELSKNMRKYLIQIIPPACILPQAIRSLATLQNATRSRSVILPEAGRDYWSTLLLNARHNFLRFNAEFVTEWKYVNQFHIDKIVHYRVRNFFLSGSTKRISDVLEIATDPDMRDGPYSDKSHSWYSMSLQSELPSCTKCKTNISLIHLTPKIPTVINKRWQFLQSQSFKVENMMDIFYFDLAVNSILAVATKKRDGTWTPPPKRVCSETAQLNDDYEMDIFAALNSTEILEQSVLGQYYMDPDMTVGKSHAQFEMNINLLKFIANQTDPESNILLGTWKAGFDPENQIISEGHEKEWEAHRPVKMVSEIN